MPATLPRVFADSNSVKILFAMPSTNLGVCDLSAVVGGSESDTSLHSGVPQNLRWAVRHYDCRLTYYPFDD